MTDRHTHTFRKTVLDEGSTCRRDLYLTTHNTHKRQILKPDSFEPTIPASERPQTHALESAATEIGSEHITKHKYITLCVLCNICKCFMTLHQQNAQTCLSDIYIIISHFTLLHDSVCRRPSSGNQNKTIPHKNKLATNFYS
jgi:hypothetical protein